MAQLLSADLPPELDFPSEFPYEVVDTSDDDDSDYLDYNLFFPGLSRRRITHSSIFNAVPTRRLAKYSSYRCVGIPVILTLKASNLTSEDLTMTILAPDSFTSPPSVLALNSSPTSPASPLMGLSMLLEYQEIRCVPSQNTATIKLELLPLTDGIITLDRLQIDVKERGVTYFPEHSSKIFPRIPVDPQKQRRS